MRLALSFVIPLYNSAADDRVAGARHRGARRSTAVTRSSSSTTAAPTRRATSAAIWCARPACPITVVEHARNFGEHNAVLTGWRHARGAYIVNLDDDGQNPPAEAVRLWQHAKRDGLDVVFGHYEVKQHSALAQLRQLVHQPDDRLGARQAAGLLSVELPLRQRVRDAHRSRATPARIRTSTACCCR